MGSLTSCLKKAGSSLHQADKVAILAASRKYRADGLSPNDAAVKAIGDQLGVVHGLIEGEQHPVANEPILSAPSAAEVVARQMQAEQAAKDKQRADLASEKQARAEEDRKRIAKASESAADSFELGGDAMDNLTGQQSIFETKREYGHGSIAGEDQAGYTAPYETDLFGDPLPAATGSDRATRSNGKRLQGNLQPAGAATDTEAPRGEYYVNTIVGTEANREIGAARIVTPEHAAQATSYLYKSAVERLDGIVTDKHFKPIAVIGGFKGAVGQTSVYPATLMGEAIRIPGAAHVWFSHNHPSGHSTLSRADEAINRALSDVFRGSGIEPMGVLAIAGDRFSYVDSQGEVHSERGIPPSTSKKTVPVMTRELVDGNVMGDAISGPEVARSSARTFYNRAREPGLMLLNSQNAVAGWLPISKDMMGPLRNTGGAASVYRAVSQSNATAAIIVHGGELDALVTGHNVSIRENVAAALKKIDVRPLDAINVATGESAAEQGLGIDSGPMFARGKFDADAFRRAFMPPSTMSVTDVQKAVDALTARWADGPKIKVVASPADLPVDAPRDARGFVQGDTAYIIASNHQTRDGVARTLGHEAIGHYGLWRMLGPDGVRQFERNLQLAIKSGNAPLNKLSRKVRGMYVDEKGDFNLTPGEEAREIAAFAVEDAIDPVTGEFKPGYGFMKQVWAKVADFLRSIGIDVKFTNAELHGMLVSAMRGLEAGHRLDGGAEALVAAARVDQPVALPDVIVAAGLGAATSHPDYVAAKAGDVSAAVKVARALVNDDLVAKVREAIGDSRPLIVPVVAEEAAGRNKIPRASAEALANILGLETANGIVQANQPHRTGMDGLDRLFAVPDFAGDVQAGRDYLLLDDTLTQGATFAALASHIQKGGGRVVGAVALTGKQYSATMKLSDKSLQQLREKHGDIESDFRAATGYGFDALTQSEARYLANYEPAQRLRDRVAAEGRRAREGGDPQAAGSLSRGVDHDSNGAAEQEAKRGAGRDSGAAQRADGRDGAGQDLATTVAGKPAARGWAGATRISREGRPITVFRGAAQSLEAGHFDHASLGKASGNPSSGLGVWFTTDNGEASSYGKVQAVQLDIRNPKLIKADELPGFDSTQEATAYRESLRKQGYDGIIISARSLGKRALHIVAFDAHQVVPVAASKSAFARGASTVAPADQGPATPARATAWRDATGRVQFAPGAWLYDKLGTMAHPLLVKLQLNQASPELKRQIRQMKLDVQKAQETAVAVAREANKLSTEERRMVSDIIEKELSTGIAPPSHAVKLAATMTAAMSAQSAELVRLGMLSEEAAARWDGAYLPRFYESKLAGKVQDAWANALGALRGRTSAMQGIKGKSLKGRGLYETVPAAELANYEALGWEKRDPDFDPAVNAEVQVWRDYTPAERQKMGEIRDAGFRFVLGYMQTQKDVALGRMFEGMASTMASRLDKPGYVRVPDTKVQGTGASRYGKLAGLYIPQEVMTHLSQVDESANQSLALYRKAMGLWKEGKTVLNPVSHVNNIVSNLSMAHFGGVSYHRADKYLAAMKDFATKSPALMEAKDAGLFLGTMSEAELLNTLPPELQALAKQADSKAARGVKWVYNAMNYFLRRPMGVAYQAEDTFFRYLLYKEARGRGMPANDAVDYAQRYIFTYDDLPKGARMVRDFAIPFVSYTYKAVPALLHTALAYPHRFAAPAAVLWIANAAAYAIAAGSDDDDSWKEALRKYLTDDAFRAKVREKEKLEREHLPPWMKGTTALMSPKAIRLGMDELTKLPLFIDVSRIVPGGDIFDVSPNAGGLPIPQPMTPSHPLFTTAVAMLGNKDLFFGKDIVDNNDTRGEATEKRAKWLWQQVMPAITAGNYHWDRTMNAIAQASGGEIKWLPEDLAEKYTGVGRDGLPVQPKLAAAQTFGMKVRPIDLEKSADISEGQTKKMISQIDAEMRSLRRLNDVGAISDRVYEKAQDLADTKKDRLRDGLTVDGDKKE